MLTLYNSRSTFLPNSSFVVILVPFLHPETRRNPYMHSLPIIPIAHIDRLRYFTFPKRCFKELQKSLSRIPFLLQFIAILDSKPTVSSIIIIICIFEDEHLRNVDIFIAISQTELNFHLMNHTPLLTISSPENSQL